MTEQNPPAVRNIYDMLNNPKRKKTETACKHCMRAKATCDTKRPCGRCTRLFKNDCINRKQIQNPNRSCIRTFDLGSITKPPPLPERKDLLPNLIIKPTIKYLPLSRPELPKSPKHIVNSSSLKGQITLPRTDSDHVLCTHLMSDAYNEVQFLQHILIDYNIKFIRQENELVRLREIVKLLRANLSYNTNNTR